MPVWRWWRKLLIDRRNANMNRVHSMEFINQLSTANLSWPSRTSSIHPSSSVIRRLKRSRVRWKQQAIHWFLCETSRARLLRRSLGTNRARSSSWRKWILGLLLFRCRLWIRCVRARIRLLGSQQPSSSEKCSRKGHWVGTRRVSSQHPRLRQAHFYGETCRHERRRGHGNNFGFLWIVSMSPHIVDVDWWTHIRCLVFHDPLPKVAVEPRVQHIARNGLVVLSESSLTICAQNSAFHSIDIRSHVLEEDWHKNWLQPQRSFVFFPFVGHTKWLEKVRGHCLIRRTISS